MIVKSKFTINQIPQELFRGTWRYDWVMYFQRNFFDMMD